MAGKKVKTNAPTLRAPQSRDECAEYIAKIGEHQRERDRIEANMNDEMAPIKEKYEKLAQPHAYAIAQYSQGVHTWCEANRDALTDNGKVKFAKLSTGEIKWRMTPFSCSISKTDEVIAALKKLGFTQYIRTKEEINKEAILLTEEDRTKAGSVKGITIKQREEFAIIPFATELEEVAA